MRAFQSGFQNWQGSTFHQIEPFQPARELGREVGICQRFSPETITEMLKIAEVSADQYLEKGTSIREDYSLGNVVSGTPYTVTVPRVKDALGFFHTHPFGNVFPSGHDIVEMITHDDKIICIGRGGYLKVRVKCFTPTGDVEWEKIATETESLRQEISAFNEEMAIKHPEIVGAPLRQHLRYHDTPNWYRMSDLQWKRKKLWAKADKLTPLERPWVPVCSWQRDTEIEIKGGIQREEEEE